MIPNSFYSILEKWQEQFEEIKQIQNNRFDKTFDKNFAKLEHKCQMSNIFKELNKKLASAEKEHATEKDEQMQELWGQEISHLKEEIKETEQKIISMLIPNKLESVIIEIRAGEGGEEASLFAMELADMYQKLSKRLNWNFKQFSTHFSETGGLKEGIFEITGKDVSYMLASESGVHCVKRIPKTEKKGRTHTSTATVAMLIEPDDVEVILNEKDLKIDFFRSSGPGGQSVNTTDSAVRITHLPTGIVVSQQDEKSQHKNREKAMKILKARVYQHKLQEVQSSQDSKRKEAIGNAKRNLRIRTYHFLQNWVKDDRISQTCHDVTSFMEAAGLEEFIKELMWNYIENET